MSETRTKRIIKRADELHGEADLARVNPFPVSPQLQSDLKKAGKLIMQAAYTLHKATADEMDVISREVEPLIAPSLDEQARLALQLNVGVKLMKKFEKLEEQMLVCASLGNTSLESASNFVDDLKKNTKEGVYGLALCGFDESKTKEAMKIINEKIHWSPDGE